MGVLREQRDEYADIERERDQLRNRVRILEDALQVVAAAAAVKRGRKRMAAGEYARKILTSGDGSA